MDPEDPRRISLYISPLLRLFVPLGNFTLAFVMRNSSSRSRSTSQPLGFGARCLRYSIKTKCFCILHKPALPSLSVCLATMMEIEREYIPLSSEISSCHEPRHESSPYAKACIYYLSVFSKCYFCP